MACTSPPPTCLAPPSRPPDVSKLLRAREHHLQTKLLENKLLKEAVSIVPVLESQIASKSNDLDIFAKRIKELESENQRLLCQGEFLLARFDEERIEKDRKVGELESEVADLRQKLLEKVVRVENEEVSASKRFQGLIQVSSKSNLIKILSAKKLTRSIDNGEICKSVWSETKRDEPESERPTHSRSNSEELSGTSSSALTTVRSRIPRIPKLELRGRRKTPPDSRAFFPFSFN